MLKEKKIYRSILPINRLFKSYLEIEENLKVERGLIHGKRVFSKESFETAQERGLQQDPETDSEPNSRWHSQPGTDWSSAVERDLLMSEEKQCGGHRLLGSAGRKH